jgi:hypothetical protein
VPGITFFQVVLIVVASASQHSRQRRRGVARKISAPLRSLHKAVVADGPVDSCFAHLLAPKILKFCAVGVSPFHDNRFESDGDAPVFLMNLMLKGLLGAVWLRCAIARNTCRVRTPFPATAERRSSELLKGKVPQLILS